LERFLQSHQGSGARRAILILGMHRSGTSVVTRTLGLRGAALPLHTGPAGPDNETGFWEPLEIVRLHDEILGSVGSSWDDVAAFPPPWFISEVAQDYKTRIARALAQDFPDAPPLFAVKDPRLCRLVPLWLPMFEELGIEPLIVLPVRNPLEIAASLKKRNSIQEEHSLLLWLRHFLEAERTTRHCKRSFICYDSLLNDWPGTIDKVGRDVGVKWPCQSTESDVEITQLISAALRHHHYPNSEVYARNNVAAWVKTAFCWALRATDHPPADFAELDEISTGLSIADVAFMPLIADGKRSIVKLNQDIEQLNGLHAQKDEELRQLRACAADEVRQLREQLQSNQVDFEKLQSLIAAEAIVAHQLRDDLLQARAEIRQRADEFDANRADAEARINSVQTLYDQSRTEISMLRDQHESIVTSTIWRALAPLRSAAAVVPLPVRLHLRRGIKLLYWIATPQKTRQRVAALRPRQGGAASARSPATAAPDGTQAPGGGAAKADPR
jgi:hypothetical protein